MKKEEKLVYVTLPLMAEVYDEIKEMSLSEARKLLKETIGDDWIQRTVKNLSKEKLKRDRPSWYATFVDGEDGEIGNDQMSYLVEQYCSKRHALIEIAMYIAYHKTEMYEVLLSEKLDYDLVEGKVITNNSVYKISQEKMQDIRSLQSDEEKAIRHYFNTLGNKREKMMEIGRRVLNKKREEIEGR